MTAADYAPLSFRDSGRRWGRTAPDTRRAAVMRGRRRRKIPWGSSTTRGAARVPGGYRTSSLPHRLASLQIRDQPGRGPSRGSAPRMTNEELIWFQKLVLHVFRPPVDHCTFSSTRLGRGDAQRGVLRLRSDVFPTPRADCARHRLQHDRDHPVAGAPSQGCPQSAARSWRHHTPPRTCDHAHHFSRASLVRRRALHSSARFLRPAADMLLAELTRLRQSRGTSLVYAGRRVPYRGIPSDTIDEVARLTHAGRPSSLLGDASPIGARHDKARCLITWCSPGQGGGPARFPPAPAANNVQVRPIWADPDGLSGTTVPDPECGALLRAWVPSRPDPVSRSGGHGGSADRESAG